jgi:hypothetical protein
MHLSGATADSPITEYQADLRLPQLLIPRVCSRTAIAILVV